MAKEEPKPSYYANIPAEVRYDENLKANAKLLYGEITALANKKGYCWASNSYFAELYNVTNSTISRWVSELVENGHIQRKVIYKEASKQIEERRLYINQSEGVLTKNARGIDENDKGGIDENRKGSTTSINNTVNSNRENNGNDLRELEQYIIKEVDSFNLSGFSELRQAVEKYNIKTIKQATDLAIKSQKERKGKVNINSYKYILAFVDEVLDEKKKTQRASDRKVNIYDYSGVDELWK